MKGQFNRQFDTLLRVSMFGEKHSDLFPPSSLAGKLFGAVADAIPQLRKNDGSQAAGLALSREGVTAKAEARETLREWMVALTRTARSIGREKPAIVAKFRLPAGLGDGALLAAARGFVENASPIAAVFVSYELPPNFLDEVNTAISRLEEAIKAHAHTKSFQVSATASIALTMETAMDTVYRLDGIVPNKLKKNSPLLREWNTARRVASARTTKAAQDQPAAA